MEASPTSSNPTKKTKIEDHQKHEEKDAHFPYSAPVAIDIGGSFTKIVYWRPPAPPDLPSYIIKEFQDQESKLPIKPDPTLRLYIDDVNMKGSLRFLKFPSSRTPEFVQFVMETGLHKQYGPGKTTVINATGGGAHKYFDEVKSTLDITFNKQDEMKCLIKGLNFVLTHADNETFTYEWKTQQQTFVSREKELKTDPNYPFPYLLVNVGSGVSILKVTGEDQFERVSGSSIGGGTVCVSGNVFKIKELFGACVE